VEGRRLFEEARDLVLVRQVCAHRLSGADLAGQVGGQPATRVVVNDDLGALSGKGPCTRCADSA
jgi:hypothetical protein